MAEAILKHKIKSKGLSKLLSCHSVGTAAYHIGKSPDSRTLQVLDANGIDFKHKAEQLADFHLEDFDRIFAMDENNLIEIQELARKVGVECNAELFRAAFSTSEDKDVPDPYYGEQEGFEEIYKILNDCCENYLKEWTATA